MNELFRPRRRASPLRALAGIAYEPRVSIPLAGLLVESTDAIGRRCANYLAKIEARRRRVDFTGAASRGDYRQSKSEDAVVGINRFHRDLFAAILNASAEERGTGAAVCRYGPLCGSTKRRVPAVPRRGRASEQIFSTEASVADAGAGRPSD